MLLKMDYREHGAIELLKDMPITQEVILLDVGDFQIYKEDQLYLTIERKTEADLNSSIKDGRWREQKERLDILRQGGSRVVFLIERIDVSKSAFLDKKVLDGAILNTVFRDDYPIIFSDGLKHTVELIDTLYRKIEKGEFEKQRGSSIETTSSSLKKKMTNSNFFLTCLSSIPRVSVDIATKIQEHYKNLDELLVAFKAGNSELLSGIELGKGEKKRKLGKKLSSDIYTYLFGLEKEI
jgi:ERCC4-type nuclease